MSEIVEAIRRMSKGMIKPDLLLGTIKSFDENKWTAVVALNMGATVEDVTVKCVSNTETTGIFIEPKKGSFVLCALTDGKLENLTIVAYSEIENIDLLPAKKMKLRGDEFGGLVKLQELENNLNSLKTYVESIHAALPGAFNAIAPIAPAPFVTSGAAGAGAYSGAMAGKVINFQDMENKNVSHG